MFSCDRISSIFVMSDGMTNFERRKFESLANELLLDLFELLDGVDLLRAFYGLNSRFNDLLLIHFRRYSFDFRSVSKSHFDLMCKQHLPSLVDRIVSLHLSDDDETPQQTDCFLIHHLTLKQFSHLKSLSLFAVDSKQKLDKMMDELCHLTDLRRFSIVDCSFRPSYLDSIWRVPKLTICNLHSQINDDLSVEPTVTSYSLQNLSISNASWKNFCLKEVLEVTPCLRHLILDDVDGYFNEQLSSLMLSIERLELTCTSSTTFLETFIKLTPNLRKLILKIESCYVDGSQWEKMINDYLPQLKIIRFFMKFQIDDGRNYNEEHVDRMLDSYRTRFWIDEHRWFVRCHWEEDTRYRFYYFYTLPYTFAEYSHETGIRFKSTCPHEHEFNSYDCVRSLVCDLDLSTDFLQFQFPNIDQLSLRVPFKDNFWYVLPTLHRLRSLSLRFLDNTIDESQLQVLIDDAPRLYSLKIISGQPISDMLPLKITSKSIRRLDFYSEIEYFNEKTCVELCNSSLGIQCEVLSIKVEDSTNILYLINHMKNLRALQIPLNYFQSGYKHHLDPLLETYDELVKWLQQHLPLTCTMSKYQNYSTRIWIGN